MKRYLPLPGLALLTVLVYWPVLQFQFLSWDDNVNITSNSLVLTQQWAALWNHAYYGLYVPLAYSTWAALASLSYEPWLFHLANLALHTLNVGLVFLLLHRRLAVAEWPAFWGALLFAVHPLQVETVAWVSGLRDLGATTLGLLSLYVFLSRRTEWAALLLFVLALLMKPAVVVVPLLALWWDGRGLRRSLGVWAAVALVAVGVSAWAQQDLGSVAPEPWPWRLLVATDAYFFYLYKGFWPFHLAVDYGQRPSLVLNNFCFYGLGPLAWLLWSRVGRQVLLFAFLALLPTLGLVTFAFQYVSTVADHYAYLAMVGAAWGFAECASKSRARLWLGAVAVIAFSVVAEARLPVWREDQVFYNDMIQKNPRSFSAFSGLGDLALQAGRLEVAIEDYRRALEIEPTFGSAILNLSATLSQLERSNDVLRLLKSVLEKPVHLNDANRSYYANLYYFVGLAHARQNHPEEAFAKFCRAYQIRPESPFLRAALGEARGKLATPQECP